MSVEQDVIAMLARLKAAEDRLQEEAQAILRRYFAFLNEPGRDPWRGRRLRLNICRDAEGKASRIVWTKRLDKPIRRANGTLVWAVDRLTGPLRAEWVGRIAHDLERWEGYLAIEKQRVAWAKANHRLRRARANLRMWLENRWAVRATPAEQARADALVADGLVGARDARPLAGAIALGRELGAREGAVIDGIDAWRLTYGRRDDVPVAPHLCYRKGRAPTLEWRTKGMAQKCGRVIPIGRNVRGRGVARWLRERHLPAAVRAQLSGPLRDLTRADGDYRALVEELGRHKKAVAEASRDWRERRRRAGAGSATPRWVADPH